MRLSEIEEAFALGKCSPALLDQFKTALRRAPKSMRPQHCLTTAAAMPGWCFPMARELLEYSLTLEGTWLDRMRAHHNLADIYEKRADCENAKAHYQLALDAVDPAQRAHYTADYAARMLVCQLHLDGFTYSEELRRLYHQAQELDDFSRSFQKCLFYLSLAEIVIHRNDGDLPAARAAYTRAGAMLRPNYDGPLTVLLKRKGYIESIGATKEALAFLKRARRALKRSPPTN